MLRTVSQLLVYDSFFFILPLNMYLWEQLGREMKNYLLCFPKSTTAHKKDRFVVYQSECWNF